MNILLYIVQVTTYLVFFYGFYHLFLRKETMFHTNRIYLVTTLMVSLVLPLVKIYIDSQNATSNVVLASSVYVGNYVNEISSGISAPVVKAIPWMKILLWLYLLGVAVLTLRLLLALKQILHLRKTGLHTRVAGHLCIQSAEVKSPFSFFKTIFLPLHHSFSDEELHEVISHEMAHVHGMHTWDVILMELLCIKLWPSPMIYLYRKSLKEVHEYVADAAVLKETPWENYAQLLVSQQQGQLQNILSNQLIYSQLKKRLLMMNQERSAFTARYKYMGIVPVLLLALILFSFREKMTTNVESVLSPNDTLAERVLILTAGPDKKIYFGLKEVPIEELESILRKQMAITDDTLLLVKVDKSTRVSDLAEIDVIGDKLNIWTVFDTGEPTDYFDLKRNTSDAFNADTLPGVSITALRLTEPSKENANDLILEDQTSAADAQKPDYTMNLPIFPGCDEVVISERGMCGMTKLGDYINKHIRYPLSLIDEGIGGRVLVKFVVGADGYVKDVAIQESLHPDADHQALSLVNSMNTRVGKWRPASKEGKSYDAEVVLPIKFELNHSAVKEELLQYAEELPRFPGCEHIDNEEERTACATRKLYEFIYTNINYPKDARDNNIEGHCIVQFTIGVDGSISDINVLRTPGESISEEVIRLMNLMAAMPEKWVPARQEGKAVAMRFTLPVKFQLQDDEAKKDSPATGAVDSKPTGKTISVVPNPASETITVEIPEGTQVINIFNASGTLLISHKIIETTNNKETINVSTLAAGQYAVQLVTAGGSASGSFTILR